MGGGLASLSSFLVALCGSLEKQYACFSLDGLPVFITPGAEPVFLGVLGEGVVLAPGLLGQGCEA